MNGSRDKDIKLHKKFIKSYKKNTIAIFLSFALTFLLLTAMLVLMHTNHRIANIQKKIEFTPSDCYIDGLSDQQITQLKEDKTINQIAVEQAERYIFQRNNQTLFLRKGDNDVITMMASVIEGRLPEQEGEIVAEKWALLNLGIEPVKDQNFTIWDYDTEEPKEYKLVGILSDMLANKKYGLIDLYTPIENQYDGPYQIFLQFHEDVDYEQKLNELKSDLNITDEQIKKSPSKEEFSELYQTDIKVIAMILIIGMVVFYGIYRIASIMREKQYGILRAVGMKKRSLQKMILAELYQIYFASVPVGIGAGLLVSSFILFISGDLDKEIYLFNEKVQFNLVIPFYQILICVLIVAFLIGIIGCMVGKKAASAPIIETISGAASGRKKGRSVFGIGNCSGKTSTIFHMGCKYIFKDLKTSFFVILTICLGVTLFTGLAYRAQIFSLYREDTRDMWYLNGQYAMTLQYFNSMEQGISRQNAGKIREVSGITSIKTVSGIPLRVIDENGIGRNQQYYDELNQNLTNIYGYSNAGYDGANQIYKSILYGYDTKTLEILKKYLISGDYDPNHMKEDEIILSVLSMDDTKENKFPGAFKEGTPLMQYKVGDEIQIKYRADLKTDSIEYESLTDTNAEYVYKTYKVAAIVSFPYMFDCERTVYPLLITSDQQIKKIAPESRFQCMYVDGKSDMTLAQQIELEQQLIQICNQNNNVSARSLISEIEQNEMFYQKQMIYIYGIAFIAFLLVLINMINNLRYRMQTRTREICMLRAIGMSVAMTKKMLLFENTTLGIVAVVSAYVLSQPVLRYLYKISDMRAFAHSFQYDFMAFAVVSAAAIIICIILSFSILKNWKTKEIVEGIGKLE